MTEKVKSEKQLKEENRKLRKEIKKFKELERARIEREKEVGHLHEYDGDQNEFSDPDPPAGVY
jgi:hypothetical protein